MATTKNTAAPTDSAVEDTDSAEATYRRRPSLNLVILTGGVTQEPVLTEGKTARCTVAFATTPLIGDDDYHTLVFWGDAAKRFKEHAKVGSQLWLRGQLKTNRWTDGDGAKHRRTEIRVDEWQFLGRKRSAPAAEAVA